MGPVASEPQWEMEFDAPVRLNPLLLIFSYGTSRVARSADPFRVLRGLRAWRWQGDGRFSLKRCLESCAGLSDAMDFTVTTT